MLARFLWEFVYTERSERADNRKGFFPVSSHEGLTRRGFESDDESVYDHFTHFEHEWTRMNESGDQKMNGRFLSCTTQELSHPSISFFSVVFVQNADPNLKFPKHPRGAEFVKPKTSILFIITQWAINWVLLLDFIELEDELTRTRNRSRQTNKHEMVKLKWEISFQGWPASFSRGQCGGW